MYHLKEHVSLQAYNTFGLEASARWWFEVHSEQQALEFIMDNLNLRLPIQVLGGGSNILLTRDIEGLVLKNSIRGIEVLQETASTVEVRIGAGENWHDFVCHCIEQGWGGVENLSLIPGCVGAAPIQNIGAYGVEIKDIFTRLEALHLTTGNLREFPHAACQFGYRDSIFKRDHKGKYLITRVVLTLDKQPKLNLSYGAIKEQLTRITDTPTIREVSEVICEIRRSKLPDPAEIGNAGSFFKNPVISAAKFRDLQATYPDMPHYPAGDAVKLAAAWLIQTCGWKGKRFGNYGVHKNQALVLVNYGGADGEAIYQLSGEILASVRQTFGIELEREVNVV